MEDFHEKMKKVLNFYYIRGQKIIDAFDNNNWDTALVSLRDQRAAFLNLKAYEATLKEIDKANFYDSKDGQKIYKKIFNQEEELVKLLSSKKRQLEDEIKKTTKEKNTIIKYRSKSFISGSFETSA